MAFEIEIEYYNELLPEMLEEKSEGKFVVIKRRELLGVFDTNDEAYGAGLNAYGSSLSFCVRFKRSGSRSSCDCQVSW
jgi:hypothetical protein